jgi:hypothetical protein
MRRALLTVLSVLLFLPAAAIAQQMPASVALGRRVIGYAHRAEVLPVVVVVHDLPSFVEAVSRWTPTLQYPVLLSDGGALASIFDADPDPPPTLGLVARWQQLGHVPPGVVVADDEDEAWAGALALAAGRGQPIVWVKRTLVGRVDQALTHEAAARLVEQIETGCERVGLPWREQGDAIEAVTLCLNTVVKLRATFGENQAEHFALTDLVGRHGAMEAGRLQPSERWAWAGQITGDASRSVYAAMCSLFFEPDSAWLFDGYPDTEPWNVFDMTRAAELLRSVSIEAALIDQPRGTLDDWLLACARRVSADLVMVNSKGRPADFELVRGKGWFRDAPILDRPVVVHFVHSWSAARPADRKTVAGRWLERGAFAYVGSVHEPFLQAFVPSPAVAGRLLAGAPLGAAVRSDGPSGLWKIAVLGDPLLVFAKPRPRSGAELPIEGREIWRDIGELVNANAFGKAMAFSVLAGNDARAVEFADAAIADLPEKFDAEFAEAVAMAAFRESNERVLVAAVRELGPARSEVIGAADALWLYARPELMAGVTGELADALAENLREGTVVRDAIDLAHSLRKAGDTEAATVCAPSAASARAPRGRSRRPSDQRGPRRGAAWRARVGPRARDPTAGRPADRGPWTAAQRSGSRAGRRRMPRPARCRGAAIRSRPPRDPCRTPSASPSPRPGYRR